MSTAQRVAWVDGGEERGGLTPKERSGRGRTRLEISAPEPRVTAVRRRRTRPGDLTRREVEVLQLVSSGMTNRAVAHALWVTSETVKFHLSNVYRKLGVGSRAEASEWAHENGVDELERQDGALDFSAR